MPHRDHNQYRLRVDGLVDQPLTLTYRDLRAMPPTGLTRDFQCVTGWRVSSVRWKGVRLGDVLDRAGVQAGAKALRLTSFDGAYRESLTLEQARRDDVLVAYELEGEELSDAHGGPVRLYVAPMYGYKSIKWLDQIEVTDEVVPGYWEERGYDVDAWVGRSNNRDDNAP
jgi:DMSO/TMAO reductase YedYZ molybdopterin-dependent catalytic subunit